MQRAQPAQNKTTFTIIFGFTAGGDNFFMKGLAKMNVVIVVLILGFAGVIGTQTGALDNIPGLSGIADGENPDPDQVSYDFDTADIMAAVYDQAPNDRTQVAAEVHYSVSDSTSTTSVGSTGRTDLGDFNPGETVDVIAFNDSDYFYAEEQTVTTDQPIKRPNLDVWKPISSGNVALDLFDETNSKNPGSISLGADDSYTFENLQVVADAADRTYNPQVVAFKYSDNISEVSFSDSSITEMDSVPESLSDYDQAFMAFEATEGEPLLLERETAKTGRFTVVSDQSSDPSGENLDIAVKDYALHTNDQGNWEYAVEDSNDNDEGVSDVTKTVTVN